MIKRQNIKGQVPHIINYLFALDLLKDPIFLPEKQEKMTKCIPQILYKTPFNLKNFNLSEERPLFRSFGIKKNKAKNIKKNSHRKRCFINLCLEKIY